MMKTDFLNDNKRVAGYADQVTVSQQKTAERGAKTSVDMPKNIANSATATLAPSDLKVKSSTCSVKRVTKRTLDFAENDTPYKKKKCSVAGVKRLDDHTEQGDSKASAGTVLNNLDMSALSALKAANTAIRSSSCSDICAMKNKTGYAEHGNIYRKVIEDTFHEMKHSAAYAEQAVISHQKTAEYYALLAADTRVHANMSREIYTKQMNKYKSVPLTHDCYINMLKSTADCLERAASNQEKHAEDFAKRAADCKANDDMMRRLLEKSQQFLQKFQ